MDDVEINYNYTTKKYKTLILIAVFIDSVMKTQRRKGLFNRM